MAYACLREFLDSDYASLPDHQVKRVMESRGYDAEQMEGFFDDLKHIASSVGQVALKAAPSVISVAAPLVGTAFGGPIGTAIGGSLGSLAAGALAKATGQPAPAAAPGGGAPLGAIGSLLGGLTGGSPAAGNLVQSLLKPQTIQALGSMALGTLGKDNVSVGGRDVPVSGFLNMLKTFIGNAEAEYLAAQAAADAALPEYLQDYSGQAAGDVASDQFRAERLSELLQSEAQESGEAESEAESESEGAEWEWEAEYDAIEAGEAEWELYESEQA